MAFLPPADFPADMNGNLYYWRGYTGSLLFYTPLPPPSTGYSPFQCGPGECLPLWTSTSFFLQSLAFRFPGFEANSLLFKDPQFASWTGPETAADDFRIQPASPGRNAGVVLPPDLKPLDSAAPANGAPDIGRYQAPPGARLAPKLQVGVRGRRVY
jgi:hypothetical protein